MAYGAYSLMILAGLAAVEGFAWWHKRRCVPCRQDVVIKVLFSPNRIE